MSAPETQPDQPPNNLNRKTPVEVALEDAEVLADYVASEAIPEAQTYVNEIAKSRDAFTSNALFGDRQASFYNAYAKLAEAVRPVTVGSLRDSLDKYAPKRHSWRGRELPTVSRARLAAKKLRWWAATALFLLLGVQSYVLVGQSLLNAIPKLPDDYVDTLVLQKKLINLSFEQSVGRTNAVAEKDSDDVEKKWARVRLLTGERDRIGDMLKVWSHPAVFVARFFAGYATPEEKKTPNYETHDDSDSERTFVVCGRIIDVLQQVMLPIVYGWLGAMAYVLRRISRESAERTYRDDNKIGYSLRIWLGVVAGLAIGWFLRPEKVETSGAVSISPFALAFVSGYSVDLLFSAMDRIVVAFSGTPAGSASAALSQPGVSGTKK